MSLRALAQEFRVTVDGADVSPRLDTMSPRLSPGLADSVLTQVAGEVPGLSISAVSFRVYRVQYGRHDVTYSDLNAALAFVRGVAAGLGLELSA